MLKARSTPTLPMVRGLHVSLFLGPPITVVIASSVSPSCLSIQGYLKPLDYSRLYFIKNFHKALSFTLPSTFLLLDYNQN